MSPWSDGVPPTPGVYQRKFLYTELYSLWTGEKWMMGSFDAKAARLSVTETINEGLLWRKTKT